MKRLYAIILAAIVAVSFVISAVPRDTIAAVKMTSFQVTVFPANGAEVRAKPGCAGKVIGRIRKPANKTSVYLSYRQAKTVLRRETWYNVTYNGRSAWISGRYGRLVNPVMDTHDKDKTAKPAQKADIGKDKHPDKTGHSDPVVAVVGDSASTSVTVMGTVNTERGDISIYKSTDRSSEVIGRLDAGTVEYYGEITDGGILWFEVRTAGGHAGYICYDDLRMAQTSAPTAIVGDWAMTSADPIGTVCVKRGGVRVYKNTDRSSETLGDLPVGKVYCYGQIYAAWDKTTWYEVRNGSGERGYITGTGADFSVCVH